MKYADWNIVNELATKQVGKFSVYVSNGLQFEDPQEDKIWDFVILELVRLFGNKTPEYYDYVSNVLHGGLFFFDSEDAARNFYKIFEQELTDSSAIYASLICPIRGCLTENT
jgi:hypothetical protein